VQSSCKCIPEIYRINIFKLFAINAFAIFTIHITTYIFSNIDTNFKLNIIVNIYVLSQFIIFGIFNKIIFYYLN